MVLVADNVILMWVMAGKILGACWRSVWVREEDWTRHGRMILLVINICHFLCRSNRRRWLGKWGAWVMSNQRGLSGWWCRRGLRRLNVIGGRREDWGDSSLFFLRLMDRSVNWVRLGMEWEYEREEWSLWNKGQTKSVFWRDRGRSNVASNTREGKEAWQRASFFH